MTAQHSRTEVIDKIPVKLEPDKVCNSLRIRSSEDRSRIEALIENAKPFIRAKGAYKVSYVEAKLENAVVIDGVQVSSRVLRKHLEKVWRVFPYVVTIGDELTEISRQTDDLLEQFWLDFIGNVALSLAQKYLSDQLGSRYALQTMSSMNPGSLTDWPIEEQRPLFLILGDAGAVIGVSLMASLLMRPSKSLSGIFFPTETLFLNCQLCSRPNCVGRRAKFSEKRAREYKVII
jgi:hypothetical protein